MARRPETKKQRPIRWWQDPRIDRRFTTLLICPPMSKARITNSGTITWPLPEHGWPQVGESLSWPNPWWDAEWAWSRSYFDPKPEDQPRSRKPLRFHPISASARDVENRNGKPRKEDARLRRVSSRNKESAGPDSWHSKGKLK